MNRGLCPYSEWPVWVMNYLADHGVGAEIRPSSLTVQNTCRASKRRLDVSSRQSRASHLKLRRSSSGLLLLLRFLFLCFLSHSRAPLLKDRKLSRNRLAQKHTMRLQRNTPKSCSIHKRLGAGVFASGLQVVSCPAELMAFSWGCCAWSVGQHRFQLSR